MSKILVLIPEALLGVALGMIVHSAATCLPVCAVSFASPLLLLGAALVILAPAAFLRGPWPKGWRPWFRRLWTEPRRSPWYRA